MTVVGWAVLRKVIVSAQNLPPWLWNYGLEECLKTWHLCEELGALCWNEDIPRLGQFVGLCLNGFPNSSLFLWLLHSDDLPRFHLRHIHKPEVIRCDPSNNQLRAQGWDVLIEKVSLFHWKTDPPFCSCHGNFFSLPLIGHRGASPNTQKQTLHYLILSLHQSYQLPIEVPGNWKSMESSSCFQKSPVGLVGSYNSAQALVWQGGLFCNPEIQPYLQCLSLILIQQTDLSYQTTKTKSNQRWENH